MFQCFLRRRLGLELMRQVQMTAGGLILKKTDSIEMRSEDLYISQEEVRVSYRFVNTSSAPALRPGRVIGK